MLFWAQKGKKHCKNRGQNKGIIYPLCFAIFGRFFGPKNQKSRKWGKKMDVGVPRRSQKTLENKGLQ